MNGQAGRAGGGLPDVAMGDWRQLMRAEYLEMPGLRLSKDQAQRLWELDELVCEGLLSALVEARFLRRTDEEAYVRFDSEQ